ncbi:MAG: alpha-glucosidase C-terminal domain-containing protein [Desulfovibrio sp.]|nr:alpha-glucosidase C-terminal domain-containing protein [Desulfovibrio sp.]
MLLLSVVAACAPHRHPAVSKGPSGSASGAPLPRADPAYLQWLEHQSMLRAASQFTSDISGTQILWRNSAAARRPNLLLEASPNWLEVNPNLIAAGGRPLFAALAETDFLAYLSGMGLTGIYVAPAGERADVWNPADPRMSDETDGDDTVSLRFNHALGKDDDFEKLADVLEKARIQLGGALPPAATGMGPDFMLQARQASRFDGIYAMVPVPPKYWEMLPASASEWDCKPLPTAATAKFADEGLLPAHLTRDALPWASRGGWAVTGEIHGADGQARRWLYRYCGNVLRPVLLWQDPSGNARRIFSAAVIQHTGIQRQALAAVKLEALMGLDARQDVPDARAPQGGQWGELTPAPEAINDIAREVHRYGGWLMQADVLPQSLTHHILNGAVDFARDAATWPAVAYALLSADVAPLVALLRASIASGVEHGRLARGLHDGVSVDWRAFLEVTDGAGLIRKAQALAGDPGKNSRSRVTAASLAARALRLDAGLPALPESAQALRQACLSLLSWRIGLPGLVFISPHDLTGALAPDAPAGGGASVAPVWGMNGQSPLGLPQASLAFGTLQTQWADGASFLHAVGNLLLARREAGLHRGSLRAIMTGPAGCAAALSKLPDKRHWLLATNFSTERSDFSINLPQEMHGKHARDIAGGEVTAIQGNRLVLTLEPHQSRHLLIY